ncbi:MAG: hypothetical protein KFB96_07385 [Thiocapsa sp.]|uniref:hypothetical protein n=1 Tax=Thiocapsa sp. TaxID=2024551 RepID=UPI001BD1276D|nr:hypothetical protein [Thiocapsa sp.]QVL50251.1 MAG: hypothetical protein KFB96_07385 [Thiocapsa sp.]
MKNYLLLASMVLTGTAVGATPPSMPEAFRGVYAYSEEQCREIRTLGWDFLYEIDPTGISSIELRCSLKSIDSSSSNKLRGFFECYGEGEEWTQEYILTNTPDGRLTGLQEDQEVVRCD